MCTTFSLGCCQFTIIFFCSSMFHLSFSRHGFESLGFPPVFLSQPKDIIAENLLKTYRGIQAHIIITCNVTGTPTPTITWYRRGIEINIIFRDGHSLVRLQAPNEPVVLLIGLVDDMSLYLNLTAQVDSRETEYFHCLATNTLGETITAAARSRDVSVTFVSFNGFRNKEITEVQIKTILGGAVTMECDVLDAVPTPKIQWFADGRLVTAGPSPFSVIVYDEGGKYLFIRSLTAEHRRARYHCEVANKLGHLRAVAPTTYTLNGVIDMHTLTVYRPLEPILVSVGETERRIVYYSVAIPDRGGIRSSPLAIICPSSDTYVTITSNGLVLTIRNTFTEEVTEAYAVVCRLIGSRVTPTPELHFRFFVKAAVRIVSPLEGDPSLVDRERIIRSGREVSYTCEYLGLPTPALSWYYNGVAIRSRGGLIVDGNELNITDPEISHSGVYQCIVENMFDGIRYTDMRAWILEVRDPLLFTFLPVSIPGALKDPYLGRLLVADTGSTLNITIGVKYDFCPAIEWHLGSNNPLVSGSEYTFTDPCRTTTSTDFYFSLIINSLTTSNSGNYTAIVSHNNVSSSHSGIYITVPVRTRILSLNVTMESENSGSDPPLCLLAGSTVLLRCVAIGYPRPELIFTKASAIIIVGVGVYNRIRQVEYDQIRIENIEESDITEYGCELKQLNTQPATLHVPFLCSPPEIDSIDLVTLTSDLLVIKCIVSGAPLPTISWEKDDNILLDDDRTQFSFNGNVSILTITDITVLDYGLYSCVGTSDIGRASQEFPIEMSLFGSFMSVILLGVVGMTGLLVVGHLTGMFLVTCYLVLRKDPAKKNIDIYAGNKDLLEMPTPTHPEQESRKKRKKKKRRSRTSFVSAQSTPGKKYSVASSRNDSFATAWNL